MSLQNILLCRNISLPLHRKLTKENLCFSGNDGITQEYHSLKLRILGMVHLQIQLMFLEKQLLNGQNLLVINSSSCLSFDFLVLVYVFQFGFQPSSYSARHPPRKKTYIYSPQTLRCPKLDH